MRATHGDAYRMLRSSHDIITRLLTTHSPMTDELIFLEFRAAYLKPQRRVYDMLGLYECNICMYTTIPELVAKQHSEKHPTICVKCYTRLKACPFCRQPFASATTYLAPVQPIDRFVEVTRATHSLSTGQHNIRSIDLSSPIVFRRLADELRFTRPARQSVTRALSEQLEHEALRDMGNYLLLPR